MAIKRRSGPTVEDERALLRAQNAALEEMKRELAARIAAVQEREAELDRLIAAERGGAIPPGLGAGVGANAVDREAPRVEARLAELREAERAFLRTRDELAARSEAVAVRERLASQRERELDDREDALAAGVSLPPEEDDTGARKRPSKRHHDAEAPSGFTGGFRRLQQRSRRPR